MFFLHGASVTIWRLLHEQRINPHVRLLSHRRTMKILFVTPYLPSPPRFGAQRRLDGLMRGLATRHEVSLLSFVADDEYAEDSLSTSVSYCHRVTTVKNNVLGLSVQKKRLMQLRSLLSRRSFEFDLCYDSRFQTAIHDALEETRYDLVQVEFSHLAIYEYATCHARKPFLVLDEHNIEYDLIKRTAASNGSTTRRLYSAVNWRKLWREEQNAWRRFDGVVLTSNRDEALLKSDSPQTRTAVVPNAVDLTHFRTNLLPREPGTLVFFGAMNYHPNIQGVGYFVAEVLPRIVAEVPNVKLLIVGQQPPDSIRALAGPHVEVVGFVDDPRPLLDRAAAMIVPLLIGGGTRFKIVEGMAMSMPMVSTYVGAEGLEVEHEKHLLLAGDSDGLVRETVRLLRDPALGQRLGIEARELAERRYGWGRAVGTLEEFYSALGAPSLKWSEENR
jgi:polysaccharide biosynthesis protein PslH